MAVHPLTAAKAVGRLRNWSATNLEINKLLYIAHMLLLGRSGGGQPLVTENFQAWDYGPVLPSVYQKAKIFGNNHVEDIFQFYPDLSVGPELEVISETVNMLANKTPGELVAISHWENGAWANHYRPGAKGIVIPNGEILAEYRRRTTAAR